MWYGIGILYDRYGSYEHAEEAFCSSLRIDPKFEKAGEIYFRLGIIYKQLQKHEVSLQVPPSPSLFLFDPQVVVLSIYPAQSSSSTD